MRGNRLGGKPGGSEESKRYKRILMKQIKALNNHLPQRRASLKKLTENPELELKTRKGEKFTVNSDEIERISKIVPKRYWETLKIPIYIEINRKHSKGTYKISGRYATMVVSEILNRGIDEDKEQLFIYRPEVIELRRELKTTTEYMFAARI
ncbi:hypothetical protein AMET1_1456 [Methanonatronarchaeum thermophilum]|uniref:Uncharacterized protein n=1 Tax=Methanonatronarchaeum thermophilum TaxID=1927129 RepID=A0A1Y3GBA0_9EURY|nr:DUF61 family protein [Methanonatronarchaeum thermophilum]OUJ18537.1 hypothetical protein AMET1_1456 [Methanonatronarchaeum thermophilum]